MVAAARHKYCGPFCPWLARVRALHIHIAASFLNHRLLKIVHFFFPAAAALAVCWAALLKFVHSEKAANFCEICTVDFSYVVTIKSKIEISKIFVAFSEYMNFTLLSSVENICFAYASRKQMCVWVTNLRALN